MQDNYNCISMVWEDGKETGRKVIIHFPFKPLDDDSTEYEIKNIMEKLLAEKLGSHAGV